jgi:glucose-6-phosphate isomerase
MDTQDGNAIDAQFLPRISTDACFGEHGVSKDAVEAGLTRVAVRLERMREDHRTNALPLLRLPERRDDLETMTGMVNKLMSDSTDVVILGIGGSSLGAQTVAAVAGIGLPSFGPAGFPSRRGGVTRLHILDNPDPVTFQQALFNLPLRSTRFLVVSKSGGTAEPLVLAMAAMAAVDHALGPEAVGQRFAAIVEPGDNPLRRLVKRFGWDCLDHDPKVGGRYSCLSVVGMVPAALAGLDPIAFRQGAAAAFQPILDAAEPKTIPAAMGAAIAAAAMDRGLNMSVLMPYADRLDRLAAWYGQLWAESLGKAGKGSTPVRAVGPVDQHSQLQLFLDGPHDKLFTFMLPDQKGTGPRLTAPMADPAFALFHQRTIGDLIDAEARATVETVIRRGRPVRTIHVPVIDAANLGYLMMHFMIETILTADLLGIDAFDQPAVEEGKILTRAYLAGRDP